MILTIRIETEGDTYPEWVAKALKEDKFINGVKVRAVSDGDMFVRIDTVCKQRDFYEYHANLDYLDEDEEKQLKEWEQEYERSWERNPKTK